MQEMEKCIYVAIWGFTEAKESFISHFDKTAAPLILRDDLDFVYLPLENKDYSMMLFNLPMRATIKDTAIQYVIHIAHAHLLIEPSLEIAKVIQACMPHCDGSGLIYTWHRLDAEALGLELVTEPKTTEEAVQLMHLIASRTIEKNLLLPPIIEAKLPEPINRDVVPVDEILKDKDTKQQCKK
eukprot:XP_001705387.1 Hypothetical protein GL50803_17367 [Giardia lamblia ATCC 50803]